MNLAKWNASGVMLAYIRTGFQIPKSLEVGRMQGR